MKIFISGKHLEVGDSLRGHMEKSLKELVEKFLNDVLECQVFFTKNNHLFVCDLSIHVGRHLIIRTHAENEEAYRCFDLSLEKMTTRMTRYRARLRNKKRGAVDHDLQSFPASQYVLNGKIDDEPEADVPVVIAEMASHIPTTSVSEAVMQMDLSDQPVMMFKNPTNGQLNVVYKRADGNIGWINPSSSNIVDPL